jgi:tetrahedral aminopeptidase
MSENTTKSTEPVIGEESIKLLERLCNASGVTGDEREVRAIVLEQVRPLADEVRVDALGNVLAIKHAVGVENPLRVMLDAHMDEVGLMIVADEEGGLFRFVKIGGIDDRILPGKIVLVGKENIPGVIGAKAIHLTEPGETENKIPLETMRIDIGPGGGKVKPGDRVAFATRFREIGPSFIAKALDDRLGCALLIEILRAAPGNVELVLAWSVQEEIGGRGARVAAYALNPDLAIAIDNTPANDLPAHDHAEEGAIEPHTYNTRLGQGPAIYLSDAGTLGDPRIIRHLMKTGEDLGIPYQIRQPGSGGTDAAQIHKARAGMPAVSVSVPGRYAHTAAMVSRRADYEAAVRLIWNALSRMDRSILEGERG